MSISSAPIDVAVGLFFIYLLISLICSTLNEAITSYIEMRGDYLKRGITSLLGDTDGKHIVEKLYNHPLVKGLVEKGKTKPSYIPSNIFAQALLDILSPVAERKSVDVAGDIRSQIDKISNDDIKKALLSVTTSAEVKLKSIEESIASWFDSGMDRISGWYKRKTQVIMMIMAAAITISMNVDTLSIANNLSRDAVLRSQVVAASAGYVQNANPSDNSVVARIESLQGQLNELHIVGWSAEEAKKIHENFLAWLLMKLVGFLATTIAVSLGAPFWFDMLGKVSNLRMAGTKPETKPK